MADMDHRAIARWTGGRQAAEKRRSEREAAARSEARRMIKYQRPVPGEGYTSRMADMVARAKRQINGNLFKLSPEAHPKADEVEGEYEAPRQRQLPIRAALPREFWESAFAEGDMTLEDTLRQRIRVGWRLVREMARIKGLVADDEPLSEILGLTPDPWRHPVGVARDDTKVYSRLTAEVAMDLANIALMPSKAPDHELYEPIRDQRLWKFIRTLEFVASYLYIDRGSPNDPTQGRYGMHGLLDPHTIRLAFPTRLQIIMWEEVVVEETLKVIADEGLRGVRDYLYHAYGLRPFEITSVVKIAKAEARGRMEGDLEDERALMIQRLDALASRARDGLDLRTELAALKQMALVLGLGKLEAEDSLRDFIDVVTRVAKKPGRTIQAEGRLLTE